jgi:16S rRNA (cytosine967-C5)-methyltransferase
VLATKPREIAVNILLESERDKSFVDEPLNAALNQFDLKTVDRHLIQELVLGVTRWQLTLDWLIGRKTQERPQHAVVQYVLRMGLYQMFWLDRIPDYAIVNEMVQIARNLGCARQSGFINAVLRGYGRERPATVELLDQSRTKQPHLGFSHPQWLVNRWQRHWGEDAASQLMAWNNGPSSTFARVNTLRTNTVDLLETWSREGVKYLPREWDWTGRDLVYELLEHPPLEGLPSFQNGSFYIQDPSTLCSVSLLNPQPDETILDACAAPGGKTTLIAQYIQNRGRIIAEDIVPDRLSQLGDNCRKMGVTCVHQVLVEDLSAMPAITGTNEAVGTSAFDRILLDVPCSNTGVYRRRVDARWRLRPEGIERFVLMQRNIIQSSSARLRPGGVLVYSTCSLEPEENHELISQFVSAHPHFTLEQERQLLPFRDNVDGAFVARLRRAKAG